MKSIHIIINNNACGRISDFLRALKNYKESTGKASISEAYMKAIKH